jgi:hypothetical protein
MANYYQNSIKNTRVSCFASTAFIVHCYDIPDISDEPEQSHLFIKDLAILYVPSMFLSFK